MIQSQSAPFILLLSLTLLALSGVITLAWGRRFPRNGDWFVGFFLVILAAALIFAGNSLVEEGTRSQAWLRGWIWPVDKEGAIAAGILEDIAGLILSGLAVLFGGLLLIGERFLPSQPRPERTHSAIAFAVAGSTLSWLALTPWLALLGLLVTLLGGFLALGSRWNLEGESELAIQFIRKRAFGIILSVVGACGLAVGRAPLLWSKTAWISEGAALPDAIGSILLIAGLLIQFQPFPILTWVVSPGQTTAWIRVTLAQIFPALASFGVLLRTHTSLGAENVFTVFGWVLLSSTLLAVLSGVLQTKWRPALGAWISAGTSLAGAILCLGFPAPALALMIGLALGATAFACCQSVLDSLDAVEDNEAPAGGTVVWAKTIAFMGVAAGVGAPAFVSSGGIVEWLNQSWRDPVTAAAAATSFALFATLGWKLGWMMVRRKLIQMPHWSALTVPTALILLSLGILWTGELLGGSLPGGPDKFASSLMELIFAIKRATPDQAVPVFGTYLGALGLSLLAAYWLATRVREPKEEGFARKAYAIIVSGYGTRRYSLWALDATAGVIARVDRLIEKQIWGEWIPKGLTIAIRSTAAGISRADEMVSMQARRMVRKCVDSPAKFLQLVQNGDVQWYLLFGIGSGLAILAHYLIGAGVPR